MANTDNGQLERELFEQELAEQEKSANKRILRGFLYFAVALIASYILCVLKIFYIDLTAMTVTVSTSLSVIFIAFIIGQKCDLSRPWVKYVFMACICFSSSAVFAILNMHAILLLMLPLVFAVQCRQPKVLWFTYVVNTSMMVSSTILGHYYGICDLNIFAQGNHRWGTYMEMVKDGMLTVPVEPDQLHEMILFVMFPRAVILFVFSLLLQFTVEKSSEDAVRISNLTWRKERDLVTGVYNKNKYEEMIDAYYAKIERIGAIYFDLNNLKKTNDTYGHEEGDALIMLLCQCLMDQGDDRYRVYRLGGDEFVMIIDNPESGEAERTIKAVQAQLKECRTPAGFPVSSAVGWSGGEGREARHIVKIADANMYADKTAYKEAQGRDGASVEGRAPAENEAPVEGRTPAENEVSGKGRALAESGASGENI